MIFSGYDLQRDTAWMKEEGLDVDIVKSGNWVSKLIRKIASRLHTLKSSELSSTVSHTECSVSKHRVLTIYQ